MKDTKRSYFNIQITNSMNKVKITLNTFKSVTRKKSIPDKLHTLNINGNVTSNQQLISYSFNEYFSSIAD